MNDKIIYGFMLLEDSVEEMKTLQYVVSLVRPNEVVWVLQLHLFSAIESRRHPHQTLITFIVYRHAIIQT